MPKCGQCEHYIGMGDWDLCCDIQKMRLCSETTEACDGFEQNQRCVNVSTKVGGFFCSKCGEYGWDLDYVECPRCGEEITGTLAEPGRRSL